MSGHVRRVRGIYGADYARDYGRFYLDAWPDKHALNLKILEQLIGSLPDPSGRWLDLACGQAWHFSRCGASLSKLGVDLSPAQLQRARAANPGASFLVADISEIRFPAGTFDLLTAFWAGYCYLDSTIRIGAWLRRMIEWTRPGGSLYLELLLPSDLESFNRSRYARSTGFRVSSRSDDFVRWSYRDAGGEHLMTSPPLRCFEAPLAAAFSHLHAFHDGRFMVHLVATGRTVAPPAGPGEAWEAS